MRRCEDRHREVSRDEKAAICPAKGMWEPRSTLTRSVWLFLSLFKLQKEPFLTAERRKRDGRAAQQVWCLKLDLKLLPAWWVPFLKQPLDVVTYKKKNGVRVHRRKGCFLVCFFFLFSANTSNPLLLEITVVLKMRGAGASPASGVHLALSVSGCDICSLISSWVMTCLTVQRCPVCSVSVTTSLQTIFYVYMRQEE